MSQSHDTGEGHPFWWKAEVIINVVLAVLTLFAVIAALWAACAASSAVKEAKETRFADNLPALIIRGCISEKEGKTVPVEGVSVENVGKGPATLVSIGFCVEGAKGEHEAPNREYLTATPMNFSGENFAILAKQYVKQKRSNPPTPMEHYVQYADIFENEYRQYFYYTPGDVAPGRFERIAKDSEEYRPVRKPPK
jgi:hypothetical protein